MVFIKFAVAMSARAWRTRSRGRGPECPGMPAPSGPCPPAAKKVQSGLPNCPVPNCPENRFHLHRKGACPETPPPFGPRPPTTPNMTCKFMQWASRGSSPRPLGRCPKLYKAESGTAPRARNVAEAVRLCRGKRTWANSKATAPGPYCELPTRFCSHMNHKRSARARRITRVRIAWSKTSAQLRARGRSPWQAIAAASSGVMPICVQCRAKDHPGRRGVRGKFIGGSSWGHLGVLDGVGDATGRLACRLAIGDDNHLRAQRQRFMFARPVLLDFGVRVRCAEQCVGCCWATDLRFIVRLSCTVEQAGD